jgi:DNA-directed RNA polymerase specialized sigma24 family protein
MLSLFDREDGKAADWPLIAETLLREAFYALDQAPTDPRAALLLRGIHSDSYDRLSTNPPATLTPRAAACEEPEFATPG